MLSRIPILGGWIRFLQSQHVRPEHSVALRVAVTVNIVVAILTTLSQLEWPLFGWPCLVLTLLAMVLSYRLRHRNNWEIKGILSLLMIATLFNFFHSLSTNANDPRIPLAELLLWLQCLHSFDLPARRDLNYSLLVALILASIGAVLSMRMTFGLWLVAYGATALAALHFNVRAQILERLGRPARWEGEAARPRAGSPFTGPLLALACGVVIFLFFPRFQSFRLRTLPFSFAGRFHPQRVSRGELHNAAFPNTSNPTEFRRQAKFNPDSYNGLSGVVDLQMRGALSKAVVARVRSSRWTYLRGLAFDHYDGQFWTRTAPKPVSLSNATPPIQLPAAHDEGDQVIQIINVEKELPNLILSAFEPTQLFFPSEEVYQDLEGVLISPYPLEAGTVYSVISRVPSTPASTLRKLGSRDRRLGRLQRYLELPDKLPPRVRAKAREITAGKSSPYEKALALTIYLQTQFRYDLNVPPYPEDSDVADYLLFEQKQGYCEQFATALAVMCRCVGLPSRYVTGFLPGSYNPFTGYHEVHGDDAHAWVEVYIPRYGWTPFEATPGSSANPGLEGDEDEKQGQGWLGLLVLEYLRKNLGEHPGELWIGCALLLVAVWPRRRRRALSRSPVLDAYLQALTLLEEAGRARPAGATPREWAAQVALPDFQLLTELHERDFYGSGVGPEEASQATGALARLRAALKRK